VTSTGVRFKTALVIGEATVGLGLSRKPFTYLFDVSRKFNLHLEGRCPYLLWSLSLNGGLRRGLLTSRQSGREPHSPLRP
jgi:hypothetical protein